MKLPPLYQCIFPGAEFTIMELHQVLTSSYVDMEEGLKSLSALDIGDEATDDYGLIWVRIQ